MLLFLAVLLLLVCSRLFEPLCELLRERREERSRGGLDSGPCSNPAFHSTAEPKRPHPGVRNQGEAQRQVPKAAPGTGHRESKTSVVVMIAIFILEGKEKEEEKA